MPIATTEQYINMLDNARQGGFAYPAINIANLEGLNAVMQAFAEAKTDGIIQVSTGGGKHASGGISEVQGAMVLAETAHQLAENYDILVALHTDHCVFEKVESFMIPLIEASEKRVANGQKPLFNSLMFDGSVLPLEKNISTAVQLHQRMTKIGMLLEVETGVVGGEEDGMDNSDVKAEELYTTSEEMVKVYQALSPIGPFLYAATFGNVHGVYKPGNVVLKPTVLRDGQQAVADSAGLGKNPLNLVFHGGSGSSKAEIEETLNYGVVKMNVDTDTQYAFTRPLVEHMFKNYDGVLKIEGEVGNKKVYDPRSYLKAGMDGMKNRVLEAVRDLKGEGSSLLHK